MPLYSTNLQDLGRPSPASGKPLQQRPKFVLKSGSRSFSAAKAKPAVSQTPADIENSVSRASPERIAVDAQPATVATMADTSSPVKGQSVEEEQAESCITSLATPNGNDDEAIVAEAGAGEEEEQSKSLMQLKMEAMTWAAMAKDYTISSLERRLRQALEIAKAEQERNQELGRLLREIKEREAAAALELQDAKQQIEQLIDVEESLCVQLGNSEVDAFEEDQIHRSQIATLTARIEAQDRFIAEALKMPFKAGQPTADMPTSQHQFLSEKLQTAENDAATVRADLSDAKTELRIVEGIKKSQSRRLAVLEKERRQLMRKGAIRSVRLAPRAQKKSETAAPGGEGWKVFSVLDFEV